MAMTLVKYLHILYFFTKKKYRLQRVETQVISSIILSPGPETKSEQVIWNGIIYYCNYISQIP